jgi:adenine-specific DNA-methyltransferase
MASQEARAEAHAAFLNQPMLTCIGNKRKLVRHIEAIVIDLGLGMPTMRFMDAFAGSSVVSRMMTRHATHIYVNDLEVYACTMARGYLVRPPTQEHEDQVRAHIERMQALALNGPFVEDGFVARLYAPRDTSDVQPGERCFYTRQNAVIIDTLRAYCATHVEPDLLDYCLAPLLVKASIHTNTAGVFKGFYKKNGVGHFGGAAENALARIMAPIRVEMPLWPPNNVSVVPTCSDILVQLRERSRVAPNSLDLIYLDPPYNQHPYGSNYFMLNLIASNQAPTALSAVSGIPTTWNKSAFNYRAPAKAAMRELLELSLRVAKYALLSYNNEGIIGTDDWNELLAPYVVDRHELRYDAFKGSRNMSGRSNKVIEVLMLISLPQEPQP